MIEAQFRNFFRDELVLVASIKRLVTNSSRGEKDADIIFGIEEVNFNSIMRGLMTAAVQPNTVDVTRPAKTIRALCSNYQIILSKLLQKFDGNIPAIEDTLWSAFTCTRLRKQFQMSRFTEEAGAYWLFMYILNKGINFRSFQRQSLFSLALQEYRLQNGWLIGKYDPYWTQHQMDEVHVYQMCQSWHKPMNPFELRKAVRDLHYKLLGKEIDGM